MLSGKGSSRHACIEEHTHSHVGKHAPSWAGFCVSVKTPQPAISNNTNSSLLSLGHKSPVQASAGKVYF